MKVIVNDIKYFEQKLLNIEYISNFIYFNIFFMFYFICAFSLGLYLIC